MLQKLWHKKWMALGLLAGITLLVATAASFPMYRGAAYDRMLQDEFNRCLAKSGSWPAMNTLSVISKKEAGGVTISRMEQFAQGLSDSLGVKEKETIRSYFLAAAEASSSMHRNDIDRFSLRISCLTDLEEHVRLLSGRIYSEEGVDETGCLEAVISQAAMVETGLLLGETVEFRFLKDLQGNPLRLKVTGVFDAEDAAEDYWQVDPETLRNHCMIRENVFREYFTGERAGKFTISCSFYSLWEYSELKAGEVEKLIDLTRYYTEESPYRSTFSDPPYLPVLEGYLRKQARIDTTLFLLQVPIWVLLGAFLFMISAQMYETERNEISVMKSRGGSRLQIFCLYLYQSIFLSLLGGALGLPLGKVFAKALGATGSFLEFHSGRTLETLYTQETFWYVCGAMIGCVLTITLPAIGHSRLSIVRLKQQKAVGRPAWWELCFLDLILLGISLYEYHVFAGNRAEIETDAFLGEPMDPLLYLSSSLFIVGLGLLLIRLQPLLVGVLYWIGKRFWGPAAYISFMENRKNGRKQQFIMLFLILAISLGIFHSTAARTILRNARENTAYLDGADLIIKELWKDNSGTSFEGEVKKLQYYEPDFEKYSRLPGADPCTRVILEEQGTLADGERRGQEVCIMGIHTREFGENTEMPKGLLEKHYYEYLNELAADPEGVLVSANFRDLLGYAVGDFISFDNSDGGRMNGRILDFVDYWPGYMPSIMTLNPDQTATVTPRYLIVANIAALNSSWGTVPYEVWISSQNPPGAGAVAGWLKEEDVHLAKYVDRQADLEAVAEDPLLQGTNGILTMGFLMTMLMCAAGYLIYWIFAIRSREMVFGILRAGGMHRGEIFHILINEQLFCGGFAVLSGSFTGLLAARMFVPILQTAYAASDQVLPLRLLTRQQDMLRLYGVIGGVLFVCLLVLTLLVRKMNVAKALKMGEE